MADALKESKTKMEKALNAVVVPELKNLGFSGTFPHYRRIKNDRFEFFSFQFNRNGGSFVMECGFAKKDDLPEFAQAQAFEKLNYGDAHLKNRLRIKPGGASGDFWYSYADFINKKQFQDCAELVKFLLTRVKQFFEN